MNNWNFEKTSHKIKPHKKPKIREILNQHVKAYDEIKQVITKISKDKRELV